MVSLGVAMKKILILIGCVITMANSMAQDMLLHEYQRRAKILDEYSREEMKLSARIKIGLAAEIVKVESHNASYSYLKLRNDNVCEEYVFAKSVTYTCRNKFGEIEMDETINMRGP